MPLLASPQGGAFALFQIYSPLFIFADAPAHMNIFCDRDYSRAFFDTSVYTPAV
jgi:hypothetical protein